MPKRMNDEEAESGSTEPINLFVLASGRVAQSSSDTRQQLVHLPFEGRGSRH